MIGLLGAIGKGVGRSAWRGMGAAGRTATIGAGVGGVYGAFSDSTSVLGGAAKGAGAGLGLRYGRAGLRSAMRYTAGPHSVRGAMRAFGGGAGRRMVRDARHLRPHAYGAVRLANRGLGKINSHLKHWV